MKTSMTIALLMLFFGTESVWSDTLQPENQAKFHDWLKNNGQVVLADNGAQQAKEVQQQQMLQSQQPQQPVLQQAQLSSQPTQPQQPLQQQAQLPSQPTQPAPLEQSLQQQAQLQPQPAQVAQTKQPMQTQLQSQPIQQAQIEQSISPAQLSPTTQNSASDQTQAPPVVVNAEPIPAPMPNGNASPMMMAANGTTAKVDAPEKNPASEVLAPMPSQTASPPQTVTPQAVIQSLFNAPQSASATTTTTTTTAASSSDKKRLIVTSVTPKPRMPRRPLTFAESQQVMRNAAPPSAPPSPEANAAFNIMMQKNMPLTPEQVVRLRQLIDVSQRAAAVTPNVPPKPVSSTLIVNLAPGTTPPAIRLSQGYVSSLVFVDSSGAPWPIDSFDIGDPKATNIQWDPKSNVLLMQAVSPYSDSNLVVRLTGLPTPVTLELVSGQRVVDYRVDIHVSGIGPNTKDLPTGTALPGSANQLLLNVLDGVAPAGSKLLTVSGGDAQAWLLGNKMYLRTRFAVLSPGWIGKMVSPDGMNAYEIQRTSSVLVSQYGEPVELKIEGF